jgi:hypothetical protein
MVLSTWVPLLRMRSVMLCAALSLLPPSFSLYLSFRALSLSLSPFLSLSLSLPLPMITLSESPPM